MFYANTYVVTFTDIIVMFKRMTSVSDMHKSKASQAKPSQAQHSTAKQRKVRPMCASAHKHAFAEYELARKKEDRDSEKERKGKRLWTKCS